MLNNVVRVFEHSQFGLFDISVVGLEFLRYIGIEFLCYGDLTKQEAHGP